MPESHAHGKDAGTDTMVIGYLIADDGTTGSIHDEPDVCFDATDFYVGFVSGKHFPRLVIVVVNEGFNTDGCRFAVIGYLLVGNADAVEGFKHL